MFLALRMMKKELGVNDEERAVKDWATKRKVQREK